MTADVSTLYLNDYVPSSYSWSCTSGASISGSSQNATLTGGSSDANVTVTVTVEGISGTKAIIVGTINPTSGQLLTYTPTTTTFDSDDGFFHVEGTGENGHGSIVKNGYFTIRVLPNAVITIGGCQYDGASNTVTITNSSGTTLATEPIQKPSACGDTVLTYTYTGTSADTLKFSYGNSTNYLSKVTAQN